jgi:hypothetical protein
VSCHGASISMGAILFFVLFVSGLFGMESVTEFKAEEKLEKLKDILLFFERKLKENELIVVSREVGAFEAKAILPLRNTFEQAFLVCDFLFMKKVFSFYKLWAHWLQNSGKRFGEAWVRDEGNKFVWVRDREGGLQFLERAEDKGRRMTIADFYKQEVKRMAFFLGNPLRIDLA